MSLCSGFINNINNCAVEHIPLIINNKPRVYNMGDSLQSVCVLMLLFGQQ